LSDDVGRPFDIVVFGATGFVGQLICAVLAERSTVEPTSWAIAGRDPDKLARLHERLLANHPGLQVETLIAESHDEASLRAMAESTTVVLTTVGPYAPVGELLLATCAETGTHYADLTGEPRWWRAMVERHHARAHETGAKIVPACGFDSIPFDLGAYFTARQLPPEAPKHIRGYFAGRAGFSGGTLASALQILAASSGRAAGASGASRPRPRGLHHADGVDAWVIPLPTIDPLIVRRSSELCDGYGPDFVYHHYLQAGSLPVALGAASGLLTLRQLARLAPFRAAASRWRPPGTGPGPERRARSWFRATFVGEADGRRVMTRMGGGDPGYDETSKMAVESALCLAHDRLDPDIGGGVLTTASAMGMQLVERLERVGLGLELLESGPA
jgi:short subunit dehydrogenase-like uncharacterized protein